MHQVIICTGSYCEELQFQTLIPLQEEFEEQREQGEIARDQIILTQLS